MIVELTNDDIKKAIRDSVANRLGVPIANMPLDCIRFYRHDKDDILSTYAIVTPQLKRLIRLSTDKEDDATN